MSKLHAGIFGPGLCGKTTLARALCVSYGKAGIRSIVLDPHLEDWGPTATVFPLHEEAKFWETVWSNRRHAIFCEEATDTISRDKDLIPAFTRLRHLGNKMHVMGHDASSLLPVMRKQFTTLYLFRQDPDSAKTWARLFSHDKIFECVKLNQYEFLHCDLWGNFDARVTKKSLTL